MILVDTSVWVDHFRRTDDHLVDLLNRNAVCMHPFVLGELACGQWQRRSEMIELLRSVPPAAVADSEEVLSFLESRRTYGRGIGYVALHLIASAVLGGDLLWTRDRRLAQLALELGCGLSMAGD